MQGQTQGITRVNRRDANASSNASTSSITFLAFALAFVFAFAFVSQMRTGLNANASMRCSRGNFSLYVTERLFIRVNKDVFEFERNNAQGAEPGQQANDPLYD